MSALHAEFVPRRSRYPGRPVLRLHVGPRRLLSALLGIALCIAAWALLAPPQLGGSTSYVILNGVSMLPNFHSGDLVLLHAEPRYNVGEVAGYHNAQLGVTVMHRIVAIKGGRYTFKGDNNSYTDPYEPTFAQIVGADWIHLPGWGNVLLDLRTPALGSVVLGLLWLALFWPRRGTRRQRRRHRHAH